MFLVSVAGFVLLAIYHFGIKIDRGVLVIIGALPAISLIASLGIWPSWPLTIGQKLFAPSSSSDDEKLTRKNIEDIKRQTADLGPMMEALKMSQQEVVNKTGAIAAVENILSRYNRVESGIARIEKFNGQKDYKDRVAELENMAEEMKIVLTSADVRTCFVGRDGLKF